MADSPTANWSVEIYKLDQLANMLPCIVRVSEGIYSSIDEQSFSIGDILWLKEKRTILEVSAREVNTNDWLLKSDEIIIPLGFKCSGKVIISAKGLETTNLVSNIIDIFPRYVKIEKDFKSPCGKQFVQGSQFETQRVLPGDGVNAENHLVVKYKNSEIALPASLSGQFTPLEDHYVHRLKYIVDRYPLPQYVEFLGNEMQRLASVNTNATIERIQPFLNHNCFQLSNLVSTSLILGHIKTVSSELLNTTSTCLQRNCVILPLRNDLVFQVLVNTNLADHKTILTHNFSNCLEIGSKLLDELFLEYEKNPHMCISPFTQGNKDSGLESKKLNSEKNKLKKTFILQKATGTQSKLLPMDDQPVCTMHACRTQYEDNKTASDDTDYYLTMTTSDLPNVECTDTNKKCMPTKTHRPTLEQRTGTRSDGYEVPYSGKDTNKKCMPTKTHRPTLEQRTGTRSDGYEVPYSGKDVNIKHMPTEADIPELEDKTGTGSDGYEVPHSPKDVNIKHMPTEADIPELEDKTGTGSDGYEVPHSPKDCSEDQFKKKTVASDDPTFPNSQNHVYHYLDTSNMELLSDLNAKVKLVGIVSPERQAKSKELKSCDDLNLFSVDKLCRDLIMCGLDSLSVVCKKEKVNGELMCTLTDKELSSSPFNLKRLNILKLHLMKTGWRPKIN